MNKLQRELEKVTPDGIRHRQLSMLLKSAEIHQRNATRAYQDDCLAGRPRFLVDLSVASESQISRRVIDPDQPLPLALEQMERRAIEKNKRGRHLPILGLSEWKRRWQNVTGDSLRG